MTTPDTTDEDYRLANMVSKRSQQSLLILLSLYLQYSLRNNMEHINSLLE